MREITLRKYLLPEMSASLFYFWQFISRLVYNNLGENPDMILFCIALFSDRGPVHFRGRWFRKRRTEIFKVIYRKHLKNNRRMP